MLILRDRVTSHAGLSSVKFIQMWKRENPVKIHQIDHFRRKYLIHLFILPVHEPNIQLCDSGKDTELRLT